MQENISIEELKDDLQEFHTYIIKSKEFIASVNELTLAHQELQKILATQDERISTDFAELKSLISAQKDEYIAGLVDCDKKSDLMRKDLEEADQSLHAICVTLDKQLNEVKESIVLMSAEQVKAMEQLKSSFNKILSKLEDGFNAKLEILTAKIKNITIAFSITTILIAIGLGASFLIK